MQFFSLWILFFSFITILRVVLDAWWSLSFSTSNQFISFDEFTVLWNISGDKNTIRDTFRCSFCSSLWVTVWITFIIMSSTHRCMAFKRWFVLLLMLMGLGYIMFSHYYFHCSLQFDTIRITFTKMWFRLPFAICVWINPSISWIMEMTQKEIIGSSIIYTSKSFRFSDFLLVIFSHERRFSVSFELCISISIPVPCTSCI